MFWKKNKDKDTLDLEFELDRRDYFRVEPSPDAPVLFKTEHGKLQVIDIGAGGLAVEFQPGMASGQALKGLLILPTFDNPIPLILQVLRVHQGVVRGEIRKIRESDREHIHYYVLHRQKEEMEARKRRPPEE